MKECYIVVTRDYANGVSAVTYLDEDMARAEVREDVLSVLDYLSRQGHETKELDRILKGFDLYVPEGGVQIGVPGTDILYEWHIIESNIVTEKEIW